MQYGIPLRSAVYTLGLWGKRHPKCKFTHEEDKQLASIVNEYGTKDWTLVASKMQTRNPRQCKDRWMNYLSPDVNSSPWTAEEDERLIRLHQTYGAKWVRIASHFKGRTDINIKTRWLSLQRLYSKQQLDAKERHTCMENLRKPSPEINWTEDGFMDVDFDFSFEPLSLDEGIDF